MSFCKIIPSMCILLLILGIFVLAYSSIMAEKHVENPEPGFDETSEYMIGDVSVLVVFVNDRSSTWRSDEIRKALEEVDYALSFWEDEAKKNNIPLKFKIFSASGYTDYVPAKMSSKESYVWISQVLEELGYRGTNTIHAARLLVNELRKSSQSDWGFIIFMVKDANWYDFNDEALGFAIRGGPYVVISWKPSEIGLPIPLIGEVDVLKLNEAVIAHEVGHIFYATDEYDNFPEKSGYYASYEEEDSNCIMDTPVELSLEDFLLVFRKMLGIWCVSEGTKRQIGWIDDNHNGIPDLLEVKIETSLPGIKSLTDDDVLDFVGRITIHPPPNRNPYGSGRDVTIVKIKRVTVTISLGDRKESFLMSTIDGKQPDSPIEDIHFTIPFLGVGKHDIRIEIETNFEYYKVTVTSSSIHTFIIIDESSTVPERVDVGKPQSIGFHAVWAHNGEPLSTGKILINNVASQPTGDGWFYILDTSPSVGEKIYTVNGADIDVFIKSHNGEEFREKIEKVEMRIPPLKVIYDRVSINLSVEDERIDLGTTPIINYEAYYEYDRSPFKGKVLLDPEPIPVNYVCSKTFRVKEVIDEKYGLTAFSSNEVTVVFDKIIIVLSPEIQRFQVGRTAEVNLRAYYAYNGEDFEGKIIIDGIILNYRQVYSTKLMVTPEYEITKKVLEVDGVIDERYDLTLFESNMVELIFDQISWEWDIKPELFGAYVNVRLRYQSDNSPVYDANVIVNEIPLNNLANGNYEARIPMFGITESFRIRIERDNFEPIFSEKSLYNEINATFISFIALIIVLLIITLVIIHIIKQRRTKTRLVLPRVTELPIKEAMKKPLSMRPEEIESRIQDLKALLRKLDTLRDGEVISEADYLNMKSKIESGLRDLEDKIKEYIRDMENQISQKENILKVLLQKYSSGTLSKEVYLTMSSRLADEIKRLNEDLVKFKKLIENK